MIVLWYFIHMRVDDNELQTEVHKKKLLYKKDEQIRKQKVCKCNMKE